MLLVSDSLLLCVSVSPEEYRNIGFFWELRLACVPLTPPCPSRHLFFPTGRFPHHHHSGPFAEEQCDRWKHLTLKQRDRLDWLSGFGRHQVDNIVHYYRLLFPCQWTPNIMPVTVLPSSMTKQSNFEDVGPSFRLTKGRSIRKWRHCTLLHSVDVLERSALKAVVAIETAVSVIDLFISSTGNFNITTWVYLKVWTAL